MMGRQVLFAIAIVAAARGQGRAQEAPHFYNPAWSPDSRQIVFESNREGKDAIYRINADGSGLVRLTPVDANSFQPSWSHDGKRIVFGSDRAGHGQIFVMNKDGSNQRRITNTESGNHFLPTFSPDGQWVTFGNQFPVRRDVYYVYVVRADGSNLRQLTDSTSSNEGPRWAADGRNIVFTRVALVTRNPDENVRDFIKRRAATEQRMQISPEGGQATPLARDSTAASEEEAISPDGKWAAFSKEVDGAAGIYIREIATGRERLLVGGPAKR